MTALTSPAVPASKGWLSARLGSTSSRGPSAPPRQVVMVGTGMDARPWRLPLPPGTGWWEVDRRDVLSAKRRALRKAGAELPGEGAVGTGLQLRCARWAAIPADLQAAEWVESLTQEGFDPEQPTVWVLEGVLMYLDQDAVAPLLRRMSELSAPGSSLVAHAITEHGLADVRAAAGSHSYGPFSGELSKKWISCLPEDPTDALDEAGWLLQSSCTRAAIAVQACGGRPQGKCDFEVVEGAERDRQEVFFVAKRQ